MQRSADPLTKLLGLLGCIWELGDDQIHDPGATKIERPNALPDRHFRGMVAVTMHDGAGALRW